MRIAAIDIGTNSIHMVIAEATRGEGFDVLDREREVVQVGRGSFLDGRLRGVSMKRTAAALHRFVQLARRHSVDRILCTATAAVREARNGGEFLALARRESGISPRVIPSEEEGRLIHLAVQAALRISDEPALIVDIGGGSAQLVHVRGAELLRVAGVPLGALRLTETMLDRDPPSERDLVTLRRHIRKQLRAAIASLDGPAPLHVYGSSGSIHALAQLAHQQDTGRTLPQVNGHVLTLASLARLNRRLERMPRAQRERLTGIDEARAEILVPGAIVLEQVLRLSGMRSITLSDYGVREGLVTDWLRRHAQELPALDAASDVRLRSVLGLLARFARDDRHPQHIAALSVQLFDALRSWHGLGVREREWLQFAALLHDIGSSVAYDGHARHSAYLIRQGGLRGLTASEIELVALVAQYHGAARPRKKRDSVFAGLRKSERRTVRWLSAMLRVAEGLDRSHYQLVRTLQVRVRRERVQIVTDTKRHAQLELWAGRRRASDLSRLLGLPVELSPAVSERSAALRAKRDAAGAAAAPHAAAPPTAARAAAPRHPGAPRTKPASSGRSTRPAPAASAAPLPPVVPLRPRLLPRRSANA
ncbi:MAG: HD domain-containing protein [Candidatus Eisenbacteria bacterium]|nr:HD domain-containing protein [Candidatus Eisenbacteria bacterium]